ncbi:MAG: hypothetical protein E6J90_17630 [Deltaproteobacteria bacterium]|nr:MAG: hypothetical protein E6J91_32065 [Deltaproteobacteria bacterium]TMQ19566.1 MAG: hypothetical protein E6J90_17630 [Deltaproteobacteria bacterium]
MTRPGPPPTITSEQRAELEAWEDRALSPEEFEARVRAPWTDAERADFDNLVRWFNRRYPSPVERLAATRHLMAQIRKS